MRTLSAALLAATILAGGASVAHAGVVLSDNFNTDAPGLNWSGDASFKSTSPVGNAPNAASVDLIGPGTGFDFLPGNGFYVDLDGTSGGGNLPDAGQLTSVKSFGPGTYTLIFDLAGNQRTTTQQAAVVSIGSQTIATVTPTSFTEGFTPHSFTFTTTTGGQLAFTELGPSSQQGNLLDNVTLTAVPEPASWAMMILGLSGVGAAMRLSRKSRAALA